jgi:hypothetical protein
MMQVDVLVFKKLQSRLNESTWENHWFQKERSFYSFRTKVLVFVRLNSNGLMDVRVHLQALENCRSMRSRPKSRYAIKVREILCNILITIAVGGEIGDFKEKSTPIYSSIAYDPFQPNHNGFMRTVTNKCRVESWIVSTKLFAIKEGPIGGARGARAAVLGQGQGRV